jgi:protein SCO1/2
MKYLITLMCFLLGNLPLLAQRGSYGKQPSMEVQGSPEILREVGIDQRLDAQVPLDLTFRDEQNQEIQLGSFFHDKPVILVLAYYRCPKLCNQVLNGLLDALKILKFDLGQDYQVVTVSFDQRETSELASAKKKTYVDTYGREGAEEGWHFLTGLKPSIDKLAKAVGFRYRYDDKQDLFAHASGIMILTPQGKVSRYFFGIHYAPRDLRLGLVEASANRIGSPVDQLMLMCYHYDPRTGTYVAVMNFVRLGAGLTLLALVSFVGMSWVRNRRAARLAAATVSATVPRG